MLSDSRIPSLAVARESMVVSQLQPMGISDERLLNAYRQVAREDFVPASLRHVCYLDDSLDLGNGTKLMEPMLNGLMINELALTGSERVLDIGDPTGYSAAILRLMAREVVKDGLPASGTVQLFDAILLNGAVAQIPQPLFDLLAVNGRVACILKPDRTQTGKIAVFTKEADGVISKRIFEDAEFDYLPGFEPAAGFVFA